MSDIYPRDLIGYGRTPPDPKWPGRARNAVQFVLNYEEGAENSILRSKAPSEAFLSEIIGAQPWPRQRHTNIESIYEYGSRAGFWRIWRMFTHRGSSLRGEIPTVVQDLPRNSPRSTPLTS
jgi:peptidoglycan/xylan/chitin deacetylase (PgdA/CDA1 family)